jgi:hypothetical protein
MTIRQLKLGWKYRKLLWKYRGLIRRRKQIGGIAAAGAAVLIGNCAYRYAARRKAARLNTTAPA